MSLATLIALVMLATLITYTLLAGADFGGGIWDLLSRGPRREAERARIAEAIGPVWEANHVWLIFLIVLLFTCFPAPFTAATVALFWPLHLVLIGIVLRGASFVFRAYGLTTPRVRAAWGQLFGSASALTPVLLGMCLAAVSSGRINIDGESIVTNASRSAWLGLFPLAAGILALLLCAYLAAVYLAWESEQQLAEHFRRRAVITWAFAGAASVLTLVLTRTEAPRLWNCLTSTPALWLLIAGGLLAPASLVALAQRRFQYARLLGGAQIGVLLTGWGVAQWPYIIYPDFPIDASAAPPSTLWFVALTLPIGLAALVPSLWLLFSVFKHRAVA